MKKNILFFIGILFFTNNIHASHIYGGDINYKHISGYTYEITLTLYGDCSGSSYQNLFTAVPNIEIYDGTTAYSNINLTSYGVQGLEVTPVCPSQANNTNCQGGTLPGVAQFIFKGQITLSGPSANWLFRFAGSMGGQNGAGRSNAITNIIHPSGNASSLMGLEATLNNSLSENNSPTFTTIPTPFFCINTTQKYNQGAVDADNDNLSFSLIPGLDFSNGAIGIVSYVSPYTYLNPLATTAGSFNFSTSTGQMSFIANAQQRSLVVNKVIETRNGIIVGTSMREMTFVVLGNCSNLSPTATVGNLNMGSINSLGEINVCEGLDSTFTFQITPFDPDSNNVTVSLNGLPSNATANIVGNGTKTPVINIALSLQYPLLAATYNFFATYQDDACPLSSKQTIAYTIKLNQPITSTVTSSNESCYPQHDGSIAVVASSTNGNVQYALNNGTFQTNNYFTGLNGGSYTVTVKDTNGCYLHEQIAVLPATNPTISSVVANDIKCYGEKNGTIKLTMSPLNSVYSYHLFPSNITNGIGFFDSLKQNTYTIIITDDKLCADTTSITISEPPPIKFTSIKVYDLNCDKQNGEIIASNNYNDSSYYFLRPAVGKSLTGIYENLEANTYTLSVTNINGCSTDTVLNVKMIPKTFYLTKDKHDLDCNGDGTEGYAEVFTNNGVSPYTYLWSSNPPQTTPKATNLYYGWYFVSVIDATGCENKDTVYINPGNCCENIFAAEAFSPNGDGHNDDWGIVTSTGMEIKEFIVMDRWGQKVWDAQDQRERWDGKVRGRVVEQGVYYYLLKYKCLADNKIHFKKGDLTIVR